jgi:two-component SAPR family response regulator
MHPGYQLRIQTLGTFRVWHGAVEVAPKWRRLKARELFQLLITQRGRMMQRDEIIETLWRDQSPTSAARNFKVALNALNKMIEPERDVEQEPSFIARDEAAYGLRAGADIWIDADEFEQLVSQADSAAGDAALELYRRALALYQGDYLEVDARYADWANIERERLLMLYLRTADHLAEELLAHHQIDEGLVWCERILSRDCCWEHAYQLMMRVHALRRDRHQINLAFERCEQSLREHLDVEPSPATIEAWKQALV